MKILSLNLKAYGPFTDQTLEFSPGLTLVYGQNESGKSSSLRAVHDMLFGIPTRSTDNFRHPHKNMRVGGSLQRNDGTSLEFLRRKGNSDTVRRGDDKTVIADAEFEKLMNGCTSELFRTMFGISHETLRRGGREIAAGQGDVGELLFAAGGAADFRQVQQRLNDELKEYWSPRKGKIRDQLKLLQDARKEIRRVSTSAQEWKQQEALLEQARTKEQDLRQRIEQLELSISQRQRFKSALALLPRWEQTIERLKAVETAPRLSADFSARRQQAEKQLSVATRQREDARSAIGAIEFRLSKLEAPDLLLGVSTQIESLVQRIEQFRSALRDRPIRMAELQRADAEAEEILKNLGRSGLGGVQGAVSEDLRVPLTVRRRIQELASQYTGLVEAERNAVRRVKSAEAERASLEQELANLPHGTDGEALRRVLAQCESVVSTGELTRRKSELHQQAEGIEIALAQLSGWSGSLQTLERLAVPALAVVEQQEQEERDCRNQLSEVEKSLRKLSQEILEFEGKLTALDRGGEIPTESSLNEVRSARNQALQAMLQLMSSGSIQPDADEVRQLIVSITAADQLVDRMRRDADLVAQKMLLQDELERRRRQQELDEQRRTDLMTQQQALQEKWILAWSAVGVTPGSPAAMREWLRKQADLLARSETLRQAQSELQLQERSQSLAVRQLLQALEATGVDELSSAKTIEQARALAQSRLEELQSQASAVRTLRDQAETLRKAENVARQDETQARQELNAWRQEWTEQMQRLHLPENTTPNAAVEELDQLKVFFDHKKEAASLQTRVADMTAFISQFEGDLQRVTQALGVEIGDEPVDGIVLNLQKQVRDAALVDDQQKEQRRQLQKLKDKLSESERDCQRAKEMLDALCREAGCSQPGELPAIEQAADERKSLEQVRDTLEESLSQYSGGKSIGEFVSNLKTENVDLLNSGVQADEAELRELRHARDEVVQTMRVEELKLQEMAGGDRAAQLNQEAECLVAEIGDQIRQVAVLRVSELILRNGMERHREQNQGPILTRGRELFRDLTAGRFVDLVADLEDRKPVLYGIRAESQERVEVTAMSEGTQDQLFLALRLASVEHWLDRHDPVPFIVDDVLMTFDDARSVAALQVLTRLAARTQVIYFTHHQHLVDLARHHLSKSDLVVWELEAKNGVTQNSLFDSRNDGND